MTRKALISGVSGQDGAYLARFLLSKGYVVIGTSRDAQINGFGNLLKLGILDQVTCLSMLPSDFRSVISVLSDVQPDEIYFLAGQTSVGLSFDQPVLTMESISFSALNFLEAIRQLKLKTRFYNSGSSECFGDTGDSLADEDTPFRPRSPYGVAKAAAHWQVANYREAYGIHATTGILFNHESPLRPQRFVTKKIVAGVKDIADGRAQRLRLGRLDILRDWGWAPDYVEAMWLSMQMDIPRDLVVATGKSHSLQQFVDVAFAYRGLEAKNHIDIVPGLMRPTDIPVSRANPSSAAEILGWKAKYDMFKVVEMLSEAE
jgi:GDPmannose 4,6-dehydratase